MAEQRQHENHVVLVWPHYMLGLGSRNETLHLERVAREFHGIADHIRHHHMLRPQRFNQMAGKATMAACKFEQALRPEQWMVHLLQQQHELSQRAPSIG